MSMISKFGSAEIGVLWDIESCPIPPGLTPDDIYRNIKSVLGELGYCGKLTMKAYSRKDEAFKSTKIELVHSGEFATVNKVLSEAFMWGILRRGVPTNLMVITRDISKHVAFAVGLFQLKEKHNNILLALPVMASERLLSIVSSVWLWETLSFGGSPYHTSASQVVADTSASPTSVRRVKSLLQ